ncbi:MAG: NADH:ubiquinone oxidoreductase [Candidatus Methanomarinus sp.]|jgi:electron transport complex protein RnfD|uniref:NADH:ubiquinone oxidoreductase n=1 Tax=Candidatus Methanomarinus sp. TaxID=3386244 RepID=A0AC61SBU8_9EURY|nr:MAG: electron transport complex protein RnfD [ANME-2 cluster archaeon]KAF5426991.1 electron transport complex protein RnfD [ANME-2 cluster archaeon]PPA80466.1 MAG: electron transport complex protein RnfD [ANME-2 cluster archaeon HR1]TKY92072.1 MAG: NADH:ubiquinone oxidoreductase [ANME-2 cluster archaeon]
MKLTVSHPAHIREGVTINKIMWSKIAILLVLSLISAVVFGPKALAVVLISVLAAVLTEAGIQKLTKQELTIKDGDAVLIGLIMALLLPPTVDLWIPVVGAFFAVALVKHAFGGLGSTLFNPAIAAWVFMNMSWGALTGSESIPYLSGYTDLFIEFGSGRLAEVSSMVLIIGGLYLIYKKYIDWRIPTLYLISTIVMALLIGEELSYVITGMLFLGIFILAPDPTTSPITKKGRFIYGILCGILTVVYGYLTYDYVVAVLFTVFFANAVAPFIEKNTFPKPVNEVSA